MSYKIVELDVGKLKKRVGSNWNMNKDAFVEDFSIGRLEKLLGFVAYCRGLKCGYGDNKTELLIAATDRYADVGPFKVAVYKIPAQGEDLRTIMGLMITRVYAVSQMNGGSQSKKKQERIVFKSEFSR